MTHNNLSDNELIIVERKKVEEMISAIDINLTPRITFSPDDQYKMARDAFVELSISANFVKQNLLDLLSNKTD